IGADLHRAKLQGADLQDADLQDADLQDADLQDADLIGAHLHRAKLQGADLQDADLQDADLQDADLQGAKLQGAHLIEANLTQANLSQTYLNGTNLQEADLREADLRQTNFSNADLSHAQLSTVQALSANFSGATFTGACIQDWNINSATCFDNVICDYIYLKEKQQERRPSYGNFAPGEFVTLVLKISETIDLIFQNGIEWEAFAKSFQNLRVECPDSDISIQAIEKKSDGAFVIRVEVPPDSDKAELEAIFKQQYETELKAIDARYREQLQAKDREIEIHRQKSTEFFEITKILASRSIAIENKNTMTEAPKYDQSHAQFAGGFAETVQGNQEGGNIHNYAAENKQNLVEAAAEIRQLLDELAQSYPTETMSEKMEVATKAIEKIESDPNWKKRVVNAVKGGSVQALEKAIDNPFGAFVAGAVEGWQES
ncbi:MAG: pentapeptide repeat-containing protein, partial [Cyanobacteriota bacterium]|nr:pentapeptide repeat-containing protein [Cyanobacteriota bacterium]